MTTKQPLALKLADDLDDDPMGYGQHAAELRRLHAENEALRVSLKKANEQAEHFEREWYLRGDENEALRGFAQEVRRTGDTRLASMAIAALAQGENT
jgi:hypothetical protein